MLKAKVLVLDLKNLEQKVNVWLSENRTLSVCHLTMTCEEGLFNVLLLHEDLKEIYGQEPPV